MTKTAPKPVRNNLGDTTPVKHKTREELGGPPEHLSGEIDPNDPYGRTYGLAHIARYGRAQYQHTSVLDNRRIKEMSRHWTRVLTKPEFVMEEMVKELDYDRTPLCLAKAAAVVKKADFTEEAIVEFIAAIDASLRENENVS